MIELRSGKDKLVKRLQDPIYENKDLPAKADEEQPEQKRVCRVCLEEELDVPGLDPAESEFVNFCKCKGHCENTHLYCLKRWIEKKTTRKQEGIVTIYKMNAFECELCKEPYPLVYFKREVKMVLYDVPRPQGTYIMLEQKDTHNRSSTNSFTLFVVETDAAP